MDLEQTKLTHSEWNSIEIPVNSEEYKVIDVITKGYNNVDIISNSINSLYSLLRIDPTEELTYHLFEKYIKSSLEKLNNKYDIKYNFNVLNDKNKIKIKKADAIRIESYSKMLENNKLIYEFMAIDLIKDMFKSKIKNRIYAYYTLYNLNKLSITNINKYFQEYLNYILIMLKEDIPIKLFLKHASFVIEKNEYLYKYADFKLYDHQKELFTLIKFPNPKLIIYKAPTGTGKTLSPLGISERFKVIFLCAARHVGMALAKSAISKQKKVAFGFGCNDIEDIKLHYFAASNFIRDKRSGSIKKVDNSYGEKVEIIISDIKSFPSVMNYMTAFNPVEDIVLYWDEPTISLDYDKHYLHEYIKNIWKINCIPNIVLSSATFPDEFYIQPFIQSFKEKFNETSTVHTIASHDFKKTIPLYNKDNEIVVPHLLFDNHKEFLESINYCFENRTILRYLDIEYIIEVILLMDEKNITNERLKIVNYFESIDDVNISNIKIYYLTILKDITEKDFIMIRSLIDKKNKIYKSTINITTTDAHTLTDGPTIYLTNDVMKIAKYCLQTSKIPNLTLNEIRKNIDYNNKLSMKINSLEKDLDDGTKKDQEKEKKISEGRIDESMKKLASEIDVLRTMIKNIELNNSYIPNKKEHIEKWTPDYDKKTYPFTSDLDNYTVEKVMMLEDIDENYKLLLLMGIGVFIEYKNKNYLEIIKILAQQQKLYTIIASTDYIYGTNYQFCNGYIGKDLENLTQEKLIQALGRIGRGKLQQNYSIRFRDDNLLKKVFMRDTNKMEVLNINKLFSITV